MTDSILTTRQLSGNLSFSTAHKMIHRLLTLDRIKTELDDGRAISHAQTNKPEVILKAFTEPELAEKLGISVEELNKLNYQPFYKETASKVSPPLNRLYCATKFVSGEYKGESHE
jgi:hypothetical protein